jgi:hypothetical protein
MQFSPWFCYFLSLWYKYSPLHPNVILPHWTVSKISLKINVEWENNVIHPPVYYYITNALECEPLNKVNTNICNFSSEDIYFILTLNYYIYSVFELPTALIQFAERPRIKKFFLFSEASAHTNDMSMWFQLVIDTHILYNTA